MAVLFVHGIGGQSEGDILSAGVSCLTQSLPEGVTTADADPVAGRLATRVRWTDPSGTPRSALCIDGWWDDLIGGTGARPWATLLWLSVVAPAVHTASVMFGFWQAMGEPNRRKTTVLRHAITFIARGLIVGPLLLLAGLAFTVCLAGEATWSRITSCRRPLRDGLCATAGDAWGYSRTDARDDVIARLEEICAKADQLAPRVVVIGHSQGGALSRHVCARGSTRDLVTLGSGANLLAIARTTHPIVFAWSWLAVLALPLLLIQGFASQWDEFRPARDALRSYASKVYSAEGSDAVVLDEFLPDFFEAMAHAAWAPSDTVITSLAILALAVGALAQFLRRKAGPPTEWATPTGRWVDVVSVWDPVCVGGTLSDDAGEQRVVVNAKTVRELPREHQRYFENPHVGAIIRDVVCGEPCENTPPPENPYDHWFARASWLALTLCTIGLWAGWAAVVAQF